VGAGEAARDAQRSCPLGGWSFGGGWQANRCCKHGLAVEDAGGPD